MIEIFRECRLCPRNCGVDRTGKGKGLGFCKEGHHLRASYVGPHFGEEPPITGSRGSGTVFFSGCSLRCSYCQNAQLWRDGIGDTITLDELLDRILRMIKEYRVHNVNFVTPDHFFPYTFDLVRALRMRELDIPIVYNLSGYQSLRMLQLAEEFADIYLPDYKYSDRTKAGSLSRCPDYPNAALEAIGEMVRQKGFLKTEGDEYNGSSSGIAWKGVLVRHLILPGNIENSLNALTNLFLEFGPSLPMSLMSQYCPVGNHRDTSLNHSITREEFDRVYDHVRELGFEHLFVQFPEEESQPETASRPYLPDFRAEIPFSESDKTSGSACFIQTKVDTVQRR